MLALFLAKSSITTPLVTPLARDAHDIVHRPML